VKRVLMGLCAALAFLAPSAAAALEAEPGAPTREPARVVEIRVSGDAAAVSRVRMTARELLLRLDVQPNVKTIDEPETAASEPVPLVIAYIDLRAVASPSIDIEDGKTHEELTRRNLTDVSSLETSVESVLHVLYLAVESKLQVGAEPQAALPTAPKPSPRAEKPVPAAPSHFGFDVGPLLRLSSLGGTRIVPGGGVALEPRADFGRAQASLLLSVALHGTSELGFERGEAEVRPLQIRVVPTFDWLLASELSGCVGFGAGLDSLMLTPVQAPQVGSVTHGQSALDPIVTAALGARVPISGRVFMAALASLDLDVAPTSFVARQGEMTKSILQLPRLRGGFTLELGFTAAGERRFTKAGLEQ
jgi:hypothetical protein